MTKHIKQRLSVKIFIITLLLLGAACSGTYLFISKLLPTTYSNLINAATEKAAMHLAEQMADFNNIDDCENELADFSAETNAAFWIEDSNGNIIYPNEVATEISTVSADQAVTFDEDESFIDMQPYGFVRCTAGNKSIAVHISVCYPDDFSARTPLCMALYTVHHSTHCATKQDFKANGGIGFFWSMYCCAGR